jgi:hypothetical protein
MSNRWRARLVPAALLLVVAGCNAGGEQEAVGTTRGAVSVTWTDAVGVDATGNDLLKTDPNTLWNAGAASAQTISGYGYVEFSSAESNTAKMIGLSAGNTNQRYVDIDFAIYLKSIGQFAVYEAGVPMTANLGPYAPGDTFRVENDEGVVTYSRNGVVFYTSSAAPTPPLLVDTSLFTPGATITDVVLVSRSVSWQNLIGVAASVNDLTKTALTDTWGAGASSVESLAGDGYVEFTTGENNTAKMAGLSNGDARPRYTDIDYAINLKATGRFGVYEAGVLRIGSAGRYSAGDLFRVESAGGVVTYARNGVVFYTSTVPPVSPLLVDTSLRTPGATILDVVLTEVESGSSCGSTQCTDCFDNDGDGLLDGADPECSGAIDNLEGSFATGIPGDHLDAVWQDCSYDGNSGAGDDGCVFHTCCLLGATGGADCTVDPGFDPATDCPAQTFACASYCQPLTPPGCDCFGCCTVCNDSGCSDIITNPAVAPDCQDESIHDPDLCPSCVKADDCTGGDCGGCILCPGQTPDDLPPDCTSGNECPAGELPCDVSDDCGDGEYCSVSCCIAVVP